MREQYGKDYQPNSRETIRRQTLHQFEQARLVDRNADDPGRATNSGKNGYGLTEEAATLLKAYGTSTFDKAVADFIGQFGSLKAAYDRIRETHQIPLSLVDGSTVSLSLRVIKVFDPPLVKLIDGTGLSRHPQPSCSGIAHFASINLDAYTPR